MEERQVTVDGMTRPLPDAVHRARHAEPDRVRRHLPAARGAARPLPAAHLTSATPSRRRRSASSSARCYAHPIDALEQVVDAPTSCIEAAAGAVKQVYVDPLISEYIVAHRGGDAPTTTTSTSAPARAARWRSTALPGAGGARRPRLRHPGRRQGAGRGCSGAPPDHEPRGAHARIRTVAGGDRRDPAGACPCPASRGPASPRSWPLRLRMNTNAFRLLLLTVALYIVALTLGLRLLSTTSAMVARRRADRLLDLWRGWSCGALHRATASSASATGSVGEVFEETFQVRDRSSCPSCGSRCAIAPRCPAIKLEGVDQYQGGRHEALALRTLTRRRGRFSCGPPGRHSGDPFGIFRSWRTVTEMAELLVYPPPSSLPRSAYPAVTCRVRTTVRGRVLARHTECGRAARLRAGRSDESHPLAHHGPHGAAHGARVRAGPHQQHLDRA